MADSTKQVGREAARPREKGEGGKGKGGAGGEEERARRGGRGGEECCNSVSTGSREPQRRRRKRIFAVNSRASCYSLHGKASALQSGLGAGKL